MASELTKESKNVIRQIAKSEGFKNYDLKTKAGSTKGDNYLGVITAVDIVEKSSDKILTLILKSASQNEEFRKVTPVAKAYEREVYMYETVFKEFDSLQNERNVKNKFLSHPKIYGSSLLDKNEFLILGNLKTFGYDLWNRHKPMNSEHIEFVFKEYGKYHALSMGLKELKPEVYNKIREPIITAIFDAGKEKGDEQIELVLKQGFQATKNNEKATNALQRGSTVIKKTLDFLLKKDTTNEVIIHGDCWCNNMLFKYDDEENKTKPASMSFLDFQIIMTGLAVQDLSYFLFINTTRDVYSNDKKFLKIYYDSFSQMLTELGCEPEKIFSFDDLLNQWKKICPFGLYVTMAIMKVILSESENAPDLQSAAESGENIMDIFTKQFGNEELYKQRICDLLEFLSDSNYI